MSFTLGFGPVPLEWLFDEADPGWSSFLAAYGPYRTDTPGRMRIEATVGAQATVPELPATFIGTRRISGRDFDLGGGLVTGTLATDDCCRCTIHPALLDGWGLRVFEQFLYLLFHHATLGLGGDIVAEPLLLHSSAGLKAGRGLVFCGPAQSGKSTIAGMCPFDPLLGDEATALWRGDQGWEIAGTPINPFREGRRPGGAPLAGLHLLTQADHHEVRPVTAAEAIPFLCGEIIAPVPLLDPDLGATLARSLDRAIALYESGLVRRLCFTEDPGFWELVPA